MAGGAAAGASVGGPGAISGGVPKGMKPGMLKRKVSIGLKGKINNMGVNRYGKS